VNDSRIPIAELIRSRRRTLSLHVRPDGRLVVRAPHSLSESKIHRFVEEKKEWIDRTALRLRERAGKFRPRRFESGETFLFRGAEYPLHVADDMFGRLLFEERFILNARHLPRARTLFERWYKEAAFAVLVNRCLFFSEAMGVRYRTVDLSGARRRWGSCDAKGRLRFSWRLILAPPEILDYVVIHELAHLKELNHSPKFWAVVESVCPSWRQHRRWLEENQYRLDF